jgi:hypothetical protein
MARLSVAFVAAFVAALLASPAEAQWKWKDKAGRVQYSDLPPPAGTPEADILGKPGAQRPAAAAAPAAPASAASASVAAASGALVPRTADPELEARRKKAEAEQAAKAKAEQDRVAAARAENCTRAKAQLATLDSGIRVARTNAKGEREFLDDKQRADETRFARDTIRSDCK